MIDLAGQKPFSGRKGDAPSLLATIYIFIEKSLREKSHLSFSHLKALERMARQRFERVALNVGEGKPHVERLVRQADEGVQRQHDLVAIGRQAVAGQAEKSAKEEKAICLSSLRCYRETLLLVLEKLVDIESKQSVRTKRARSTVHVSVRGEKVT